MRGAVKAPDVARSVGLLGFQRLAVAALGVARAKIAAILLGPAGMGILAQAIGLQDLMRSLAMLGTPNAFVKLVAQHRGEGDLRALERLLSTAFLCFTGLAAAIAVLCILGARPIAERVLGDPARADLVLAVALSLLFLVPVALISRVFAGLLDYRCYALFAIAKAGTWLGATALLAYFFGVAGAVWALVLVDGTALLAGAVLLYRRAVRPLGLDLRLRAPDRDAFRRLLRLASALAVTSFAATGAALLVRSAIVRSQGAHENGLYQVAWQVGQNYLAFLGAALWTYGMPRIATQLDDPRAVTATQNQFLRIALLVLAPGIVVLLATRESWIPILFSREFLGASGMLCWQLMGELLAMLRQSMNISLLPRERLGFLVFQGVLYWGSWAAISLALLGRLGGSAAALGYLLANGGMLLVTYAYHRRVLGFALDRENRHLLFTTAPVFALGAPLTLSPDPLLGTWLPLGLVALWAALHRARLRRMLGRSGR